MKPQVALILALSMLPACASIPLRPAPQKLQPWTVALRNQQPEDAFAAVYRVGPYRLVFVGAQHTNQNDSLTFRIIRDAYANFKFDTVIAEGFPTSWGVNPPRILDDVARSKVATDGFVEGGETVPTVLGAQQQLARVFGGETDDLGIKKQVAANGISEKDLLGFYVLRNVPQWIGERELKDASDPRLAALVKKALARQRDRLQMSVDTLSDYPEWLAWYEETNGKPLNASFDTEEVGPLADGRLGTNRIAYAVSRARDAYLHRLIVDHLNSRENVLVVFGGSHLMIHRPALDAVLGSPCYSGTDVRRAATTCH
jgi:hypothetical protein